MQAKNVHMMFKSIASIIVYLFLFLQGGYGEENETFSGFMKLPALGLTEIFHFSPTIMEPHMVEARQCFFNSSLYWVNIWSFNIEADESFIQSDDPDTFPLKHGTYLIDMEVVCLTNSLTYGISDKSDATVSVPVYLIGGGIMDGFIENFHDAIHIDQHSRTELERDRVNIFYVDEDNRQHWFSGSDLIGFNLGNIVLYGGYRFRERKPAVSMRASIKLPTHTSSFIKERNNVDYSLQYSISWHWGKSLWYHGAGYIYYNGRGYNSITLKRHRFVAATTIEYPTKRHFSWLVHIVTNSPAAEYPNQLDKPVFEVSLGFRWLRSDDAIDFGLIENMFWHDNSPDFGLFLSMSKKS